jgi:manganese transport protein
MMATDHGRPNASVLRRIWLMLLAVGPGIFCIGYTIGTGSVTSMAKAGSQYGMQLLWVLLLSCLFSWVLMEAYGRYAVVTGETAIHSFKTDLKFGRLLAILTIVGVVTGQWNSLSGILGLSANAIYETARLFMPGLAAKNYWAVLGIAIALILTMYAFLLVGRYSFFEKLLIVFVTLMGISFFISMAIVMPAPAEIAAGLVPSIPSGSGGRMMVAAFVGTTMAAPTFVVRPLLMQGKGWGKAQIKDQARDAAISACLMFVISASIMICATGALFHDGKSITKILDMVTTLEPIAGRYAVAIFMVGALSAGLSSIFPIMMVCPLLIADYRAGQLDTNSKQFRILCGVACLMGLGVPILGANPIAAQIATQVANVFVLPLVIGGIIYLVNQKHAMGPHRAGVVLNAGLAAALVFSCVISYTGVLVLVEMFF